MCNNKFSIITQSKRVLFRLNTTINTIIINPVWQHVAVLFRPSSDQSFAVEGTIGTTFIIVFMHNL